MAARGQKDAFTITGTDHPDPRRHRHPRLRPRLGPRPRPRARDRAVRRGARRGRASPASSSTSAPATGVTVRELVAAFERVFGSEVPVREAPPRPGDARGRLRQRRPRRTSCSAGAPSSRSTRRSPRRWPGARSARRSWATSEPSSSAVCSLAVPCFGVGARRRRRLSRRAQSRPAQPPAVGSRLPLAGRVDRDRPGPPARQPQLPATRSTGWCRPAASASPATPRARRPTAATRGDFTWDVTLRLQATAARRLGADGAC